MTSSGIKMNEYLLSITIHAFMYHRKPSQMIDFFQSALKDKEIPKNAATFNAVLQALYEAGDVDLIEQFAKDMQQVSGILNLLIIVRNIKLRQTLQPQTSSCVLCLEIRGR
jgi:hypothetical protein